MGQSMKSPACKVLVVEDEFLVALQLEDILTDGGYTVVGTISDLDSLAAVEEAPDIAFVDLNLRDGLTGPEIAHALAERFSTRVIYATANPAQIGAPASTTVGVLRKPFCDRTVLDAIAYAVIGVKEARRPLALEVPPALANS